jgi:hypothetical protein
VQSWAVKDVVNVVMGSETLVSVPVVKEAVEDTAVALSSTVPASMSLVLTGKSTTQTRCEETARALFWAAAVAVLPTVHWSEASAAAG